MRPDCGCVNASAVVCLLTSALKLRQWSGSYVGLSTQISFLCKSLLSQPPHDMADKVEVGAAAVALAAAGMFAGSALFITAVEHPAAMKDSCSNFYSYFTQMFPRAARLQGGLAILGSHAAMVAAAKSPDSDAKLLWGLSSGLLGAVWPWTLLAMMPTNKKILKQDEKDETVQSALLTKWGQLHSVRTVLSMSAFAVMLAAALRKRSA